MLSHNRACYNKENPFTNGVKIMEHALFGTKHLILIAISTLLIVVGAIFAKKLPFKQLCKLMFIVGIVSEIIKIFYYIQANEDTHHGVLPKSDLPFHLCSIQIIFIAILTLTSNEKLHRFLLSFMRPSCLFGGIAAILIATHSSRNGSWLITSQYFLYHVALVIFALWLYTSKEIRFELKDYFNCLKFLLVLLFFSIYINGMLSDGTTTTNFMYVVAPPQDGLPFLNDDKGWLSYILRYASLILFCITISYIAPIIRAIKAKRSGCAASALAVADAEQTSVEQSER